VEMSHGGRGKLTFCFAARVALGRSAFLTLREGRVERWEGQKRVRFMLTLSEKWLAAQAAR
jgi:hypothetical protein